VNPLRSVGGRLALALLLVVAGALAIVYVVVVPSYERSLVDARVKGLETALRTIIAEPLPTNAWSKTWVEEEAAPIANARVVVLERVGSGLEPYSDSDPRGEAPTTSRTTRSRCRRSITAVATPAAPSPEGANASPRRRTPTTPTGRS
jgi:hypothetical protein